MTKIQLQEELDKSKKINIQLNSEVIEALSRVRSTKEKDEILKEKDSRIRGLEKEVIAHLGVIKFLKSWLYETIEC